ncbi:cobalamin-dependent protein [Thermogymnomonas acidicola]|uniref:cobalamin B12-binding domain-containing protein n=1 Tax=Thermogymnomonas acidicola TaxID=399579 RepID=UPI001396C4B2|nr:cobalamin-dependent protein [Thermogymnomonas acidicola]
MEHGENPSLFEGRPIKVLLAKPGIDGHDRGVLVLAKAFRDAGMDVIYAGLLPTPPEEVVDTAVNEDVDVIALSLLNGAHMTVFKKVADLMKKRGGIDDIAIVGGGHNTGRGQTETGEDGHNGGELWPGHTPLSVIVEHIRQRATEARLKKLSR